MVGNLGLFLMQNGQNRATICLLSIGISGNKKAGKFFCCCQNRPALWLFQKLMKLATNYHYWTCIIAQNIKRKLQPFKMSNILPFALWFVLLDTFIFFFFFLINCLYIFAESSLKTICAKYPCWSVGAILSTFYDKLIQTHFLFMV